MGDLLRSVALGALLLAPQIAVAEDAALIIVESDYRRLADVAGADEAASLAQALEAAGFRVTSTLDQSAEDAWRAVADWRADAVEAERVLVFLSGHMVSTARDGYLLTRSADAPTDLSVGGQAVPLGPILDTLAAHQGQAVLMLAPSTKAPAGAGLAPGASPQAPQGVTLISGPAGALLRVAREVLLVPGAAPASGLADAPRGVAVSGFVSDALPFLPPGEGPPAQPPRPTGADPEAAYWSAVQSMASREAYAAYLERYPGGRYGADARAAIAALENSAQARLIAVEEALGLDREARKEVQRALALLGYEPRGIDGIFGPGSRAAIAAWQRAVGSSSTGYLTGADMRTLTTQAEARAAQLAAEAEARRAEQERLDRVFWTETGGNGDEAGLRAYLKRYPDGLFAEVARARLDEIEATQLGQAQAQERQMWDQVRAQDTATGYRDYLDRYPNGIFSEAAQARIAELTQAEDEAAFVATARSEEDRVAGNQISRLLVETRLKALGYDPGRIDGSFDEKSRRAIRQFQRTREIAVTGYVSQETMVHLLAVR